MLTKTGKTTLHNRNRPERTVSMISLVMILQNFSSPSVHSMPKKPKKKAVAKKTINTMVYPRWMCILSARFNGTIVFTKESPRAEMEYLDIVRGINAIWKRIACIEPNSRGGIVTFQVYLLASSGTVITFCSYLIRAKWAAAKRKQG